MTNSLQESKAVLRNPRRSLATEPQAAQIYWLDLLILTSAMLATVFAPAIKADQMGWASILVMRISLMNCFYAVVCIVLWQLCLMATSYRSDHGRASLLSHAMRLGLRAAACTAVTLLVFRIGHPERFSFRTMLVFWVCTFLVFLAARLLFLVHAEHVAPSFRRDRKVIVVGTGWRARQIADEITSHAKWHYELLGFVDNDPQSESDLILGGISCLDSILMQTPVDEVIIALPVKSCYDDIQAAIRACERSGVQSSYSTDIFETTITKRRSMEESNPSSVVLHMVHNDRRLHLKRALDIVGAAFGLIVLSPILLLVAIAVKWSSKGPVFFTQQRYGLNKRTFSMYKFRSMVVDAEAQQGKLEHLNEAGGPVFKIRKDPRVTRVGSVLRRTSLDELPQLLNVLRGDMSLVGPRPLPLRDVNRFSEAWLMRRFSVRPGVTGLWQVSGRSDITFANWILLDLEYIDAWSLNLDLRILMRTFSAVLKKEGAV